MSWCVDSQLLAVIKSILWMVRFAVGYLLLEWFWSEPVANGFLHTYVNTNNLRQHAARKHGGVLINPSPRGGLQTSRAEDIISRTIQVLGFKLFDSLQTSMMSWRNSLSKNNSSWCLKCSLKWFDSLARATRLNGGIPPSGTSSEGGFDITVVPAPSVRDSSVPWDICPDYITLINQ